MRIAVIGCGAMGSVYAARLASGGNDVTAVTRNVAHATAMARSGLVLSGPDGTRTVRVAASASPPAETFDLVVLAVKAGDVASAAPTLMPLLGPHTLVVTLQNGLGSAEVAADAIGADRLVVGIATAFGASLPAPGHVQHTAMRSLKLGAYGGLDATRVEEVASVWRTGGFDADTVADIAAMQWEKLICNVAYSGPCALSGLTVGEVMDHEQLGQVSRRAAVEAWETARALDIGIDVADPVEHALAFGRQVRAAKPSALLDHEAGRVSEIAVINGAVPREAAKAGRDAPVNATIAALALAREQAWTRPAG
jgi:2-dehydropantoate 2-reductase